MPPDWFLTPVFNAAESILINVITSIVFSLIPQSITISIGYLVALGSSIFLVSGCLSKKTSPELCKTQERFNVCFQRALG